MQLLIDKRFDCSSVGKNLFILQPPLTYGDPSSMAPNISRVQGFTWYPNCIFFPFRYGNGWLKVVQTDKARMRTESSRAIILPFEVPDEGYLTVGGSIDDTDRIDLPPGQYKLLFELKTWTLGDILSTEKYQQAFDYSAKTVFRGNIPELCTVTFVPAREEVKPELLKFSSWGSNLRGESTLSPKELVLFEYLAEEPY